MKDPVNISSQLQAILESIQGVLPEMAIASLFIILIAADLILKRRAAGVLPYLALAGLTGISILTCLQLQKLTATHGSFLFMKFLHLGPYETAFKLLFMASGIFTVWLTLISGASKANRENLRGEYYALIVALLLGLNLLVMASNLLMVYISLEFVSITSYILSTFAFNRQSSEGGMKYLLFGAFSSGLMLYGMSFFYGFTGSMQFYDPAFLNSLLGVNTWMLMAAGILVLAGFLFKIAAFPFQVWAPDVYQGAPAPITAFFSIAPKAGGIALIINFTYPYFYNVLHEVPLIDWKLILGTVALITLTIGNLAALGQNNAKRLLAYSSIAHAGFILCAVLAFSRFGVWAVIFYFSVYLPMNFAAFGLVELLSEKTGSEDVRNFKGLGGKLPLAGVIFVLVMVALTGLPPTAGFNAKLLAFSALWEAYQESGEKILLWVFVAGLLNSVIALFYYLKIPYYMFLKSSENKEEMRLSPGANIFLLVMAAPLLVFFFKPDWILYYIQKIILNF